MNALEIFVSLPLALAAFSAWAVAKASFSIMLAKVKLAPVMARLTGIFTKEVSEG